MLLLLIGATAGAAPFQHELDARLERFRKEGAKPQAVVPLLGLLDFWEVVPDRAVITRFLDEAVASQARADVRARAAYDRAILDDREGRFDEAQKARSQLGVIDRFWVAGPFDNEGRAGHATVFPPEKDQQSIDLDASFSGKERKVGWRRLPEVAVAGAVSLDTVLRPETNVTAYATVAIHVPRAQGAAVRVGSTGAVKVWVNGRLAVDHDVYRPMHLDQDAGPALLRAGWNRVLVKLSAAEQGGFSFLLRVTKPDGSALESLQLSTERADLALARGPAPKGALPAVASIGRDLERAAHAKNAEQQALTDWGLYLHHVTPEDPDLHLAAEALSEALHKKPSPEAWARLAAAQRDPNDQRKSLEEALALAGDKPSLQKAALTSQLAELYFQAHRERRAEALWRQALSADASYYLARIRLAELDADRGLPARAEGQLAELAKTLQPEPLRLLRAQAQLALRRGRRAQAEALERKLYAFARDDADLLHQLFGQERARGLVDEALATLAEIAKRRPDLTSASLDRAELFDGAGRLEDAHRALAQALAVAPEDARLLERDGRILHRLGREPDALERLRKALELRPQNPELRAYVSELESRLEPERAKPGSDLARAWAVDPRSLGPKAGRAPDGEPARVLYDGTVTRVHANGLSETFQQRVVEVLDERGARAEGEEEIRYTPDTQSLELRAARVYRPTKSAPGGFEVLEAIATDENDASEPWYGLYYDIRAQSVRFQALQPGDVIDIEYVLSDVGHRNLFADYFGELHFLQEEMPRADTRFVLIAPKGRTLYFNDPRLASLEKKVEESGEERVYSFRAKNVPKIDQEPGMPGFSSVAAYVHVSTYKSWEDVASWYQGLVKTQLDANPAIVQAVKEAVKGLTDERAKIRAVYDLVVKKTRYVGLEFGIHGYQPYRVSQVFARKFGDCKDKASLLVVMLREAGIPAELVLARTRQGGDLDATPASLAPFDHAIAYVPKYGWYLDGTAEFSGSDELPAQDQDIPVLRVSDRKLVRTPVLPAQNNRVTTSWEVQLDATGAARVEEHMTVAGEAAHEWRSVYQAPGERNEKYEQAWNGKQPGARIEKLQMAVDDLEKPVEVQATVDVPHFARVDGEADGAALTTQALGRDPDLLRSYARLSSRRHELVLGYPWRQGERVRFHLPAGFTIKRLPEARQVTSPFGRFQLAVQKHGSEVEVTATLDVGRHKIATGEYAAFRRFCAQVDDAVGQELVIEREPHLQGLRPPLPSSGPQQGLRPPLPSSGPQLRAERK